MYIWLKKLTIILLAAAILLPSTFAMAESISDGGSSTVTVKRDSRYDFLSTTAGNSLGGGYWQYLTNAGISGPAFCVNHGLSMVSETKPLQIAGRYTGNTKTMGAFANGYPQRSLADFLAVNQDAELAGLTEDEYKYATQVAVWATLGQVAVDGTSFTSGRSTIAKPNNDAQKLRVYKALQIILNNASYWTKPLYTGMHIRAEDDSLGNLVQLDSGQTLNDASLTNAHGIRKETINGTEYYTRKWIVSSATSTYPSGYTINVWSDDAPSSTVFVDTNNNILPTGMLNGRTVYKVTADRATLTDLNANGSEYAGVFKICIPVNNVTDDGKITIRAYADVIQYDIYLAHNPVASEQSYIIADPSVTDKYGYAYFNWGGIEDELANLTVTKVDGTANPLDGATFALEGSDGSTKTGTTDANGQIKWEGLNPNIGYTLRETVAPAGYAIVAAQSVRLNANETNQVVVRNNVEPVLRVKKQDAQNGYSILGATFRFEQIDGSFKTDGITGHDGMIEFTAQDLPFGSYKVYETQAPEGYKLDTQEQTVHWDGSADVLLTFQNVREQTLVIIKTDESGRSLPGAVFKVYKDGQPVTTVTTNDAGEARVSGVSEGYWEAEEITAPFGYVLDSTRHGIYIDPYDPATTDDPVLIVPNKARPSLRILKYYFGN